MKNLIHGSVWWKCDFHNHTPASNDYGSASVKKEDMTPREWLLGYMRAGIDCVGITDHNTGAWVDKLKEESEKLKEEAHTEYRRIYLYPGVEISVSGGIHVLALFDPSKSASDIFSLLGAVGFKPEFQGSGDAVTKSSLEEVILEITGAGGIAVPAHVDKRSGMFEVLGNKITAEQVLSLNQLLAIEVVDSAYEMPEVYRRKGLQLANIAGSDSHHPDTVGGVYTWVKMREPNIDALKLALHDGSDGVIRWKSDDIDPNNIENRFFIHSLKISNGMMAGNGTQLAVNFSPWMTSIIGGRGSGKSSMFNYLRLPFNKTDDIPESIKVDFDRFAKEGVKGADGMLRSNTLIEVEFFKDTRNLKLEYNAQTKKRRLLEKNEEGQWEISSDDLDPSKHFPINIFSQKHLYELAKNPNHILRMINARFDKTNWEAQLFSLETEWMGLRNKERELEREIKNEPDLKEELNALNSRLQSYENSEKELLTEFKQYSSTNDAILSNIESFNILIDQLGILVKAAETIELVSPDIESSEEDLSNLSELDKSIKIEVGKLSKLYTNLENISELINPKLKSTPWYIKYNIIQEKYNDLRKQLEESGQVTDINYDELLRDKKTLDETLAAIAEKRKDLQQVKLAQLTLRANIYSHHRLLRTYRKESISGWDSLDSKQTIAIHLEELRDYHNSEYSFRSLIGKPGSEFESEILQRADEEVTSGILYDIMNMKEVEDRWINLDKRIEEFVSSSEAATNNFGLRLIRHKEKHKAQAPEMLDRLLIWAPDDRIVLKLIRDGHEEDIDTGSAGQKTAGMLSLLLTADDTPLLIDQPEDDLDTRLISELLVANFKVLKKKRQIIVVTHNPNIAVNGSSEKIIQMEFKNGQIVKLESGALQDKTVRGAVCEIMEGGKEALDKRYYRISQALESV